MTVTAANGGAAAAAAAEGRAAAGGGATAIARCGGSSGYYHRELAYEKCELGGSIEWVLPKLTDKVVEPVKKGTQQCLSHRQFCVARASLGYMHTT